MTVLIAGATGATGRLLVRLLLERGHRVRAIVRSPQVLDELRERFGTLELIQAGIADASDADLSEWVSGCDVIASCLGHNLTLKGLFAPPRRLVTDATRRLCDAAARVHAGRVQPSRPVRFVLMNTTGNTNRDLNEPRSVAHRAVIWTLRHLLPPQADNEEAAEVLRTGIGDGTPAVEWVAVRPDGLVDEPEVSDYRVFSSPVRDPVFNAGKTSRINVADFMARLITDDDLWSAWKGQMPVVYNASSVD